MEESAQDSSNINPLGLLFLLAMSVVMLRGRRAAAVQALLGIAAFLPLGQQFVFLGLHFQFFRILILVGFCRLAIRQEFGGIEWTRVDKLFAGWALAGMVCGFLRNPAGIAGLDCLGGAFNSFGTYFLIRFLIRDPNEIVEHMRFLAVAIMIIGAAMVWETLTHRNLFYVLGGVPQFVGERAGRFRCQGPFRHPILAGTFAATLFPLIVGLLRQGKRHQRVAIGGLLACLFCSYAAASSGAIMTCMTGLVGLSLWPLRDWMRWLRRGMVAAIVLLSLVMHAPVYYLIAKLGDVLGGTGWHRSYLIDQALIHFKEWWLIGTSVTAHWAPAGEVLAIDPQNMDITNHYIKQGIQGGLLRLVLFIMILVACFRAVGKAVREPAGLELNPRLLWAVGVALAAHCTAFISISYFDQIEVFWFWLLAGIAAVSGHAAQQTIPDSTAEPFKLEVEPLVGAAPRTD